MLVHCRECGHQVSAAAPTCPMCGAPRPAGFGTPVKSNLVAGCLGLALGPVGLWYKGNWAAGFAWLVMSVLTAITGGAILLPLFWIGMGIHAALADPK